MPGCSVPFCNSIVARCHVWNFFSFDLVLRQAVTFILVISVISLTILLPSCTLKEKKYLIPATKYRHALTYPSKPITPQQILSAPPYVEDHKTPPFPSNVEDHKMTKQHRDSKLSPSRDTFNVSGRKKARGAKYQPIRDIFYSSSNQNSDRAVFVLPRRMYYGKFSGGPQSTVVALVEAHDNAVKTIVACELDGYFSESISMLKENTRWIRKNLPQHTHMALAIECKGLPQKAIFNGSTINIIYKKKGDNYYSRVKSEKPLVLRHVESLPTNGRGSIFTCSTMWGHPEKFDQWLMYQNYLGIELVHLDVQGSFLENVTSVYPYYSESVRTGFTRIDIWSDALGERSPYYSQKLKYLDCIYRYKGVFDYGLFCDTDDFFNPMLSHQKDIHDYLPSLFPNSSYSSSCMSWRNMLCKPIQNLVKDVPHGNLTSILGGYKIRQRVPRKCIHRMNAILFVEQHAATKVLKGYRTFYPSAKIAYVAHNRYNATVCQPSSN